VLLSTLLKECGPKSSATWFVAEGAEEVKGASSMPTAKTMDDCLVASGMNGRAVRSASRRSRTDSRPRRQMLTLHAKCVHYRCRAKIF
jgi:hypothetical protein